MKKATKSRERSTRAAKLYAGTGKGVGRLNAAELDALMKEMWEKAKKMKFKRGPNGVEIRPEDTATGRGLVSFRIFPPDVKTKRK